MATTRQPHAIGLKDRTDQSGDTFTKVVDGWKRDRDGWVFSVVAMTRSVAYLGDTIRKEG